MNIHQQHFETFCTTWESFEHDGSNPNRLNVVAESIVGPVAVVGGGLGLVSKYLIDKGFAVTTIDISESMAQRARESRGIETVVTDFLNYRFPRPVSTLIVNTGVFTPSVTHNFGRFARQIALNLADEGVAIVGIHERGPFDEVTEYLGLTTSSSLLAYLCEEIESGSTLHGALQTSEVSSGFSDYVAYRFADEFDEYETQIRAALDAYSNGKLAVNSREELAMELRYVQFGLSHEQQVTLMCSLAAAGLIVTGVHKENSTVLVKIVFGVKS